MDRMSYTPFAPIAFIKDLIFGYTVRSKSTTISRKLMSIQLYLAMVPMHDIRVTSQQFVLLVGHDNPRGFVPVDYPQCRLS
jgi:hypothetical protein